MKHLHVKAKATLSAIGAAVKDAVAKVGVAMAAVPGIVKMTAAERGV